MVKIECILSLLFLCLSIEMAAQSDTDITIAGIIVDHETQAPLGYASIDIASQGLGTVSNSIGHFVLTVPEKFINDTLTISYLGYSRYTNVITKIRDLNNLKIELISSPTLLKEISIQATTLDGNYIMEKVMVAIKDNYPTDAFILEGFFRDIEKQNEHYVELTEAAIKVFDKNFQRKLNTGITEEVVIVEARKSFSYADPIVRQIRKQNAIVDLLDNNPVHYPRGLLNKKYFSYQVDSVFQSQDDMIYVISTIPGNHKIFVSESNYAIVKAVEIVKAGNAFKRPEYKLNDSLSVSRMAYFVAISEFQEYNGKMYLKYSSELDAFEVLNKASRRKKFLVESFKEFVVTNIIDRGALPFDKKVTYKFNTDIAAKKYNPDFWSKQSNIQLSPLDPEIEKSLAQESSLEDQFSGKKQIVK